MGYRLHVAKKYVVEYTTSASFSYEVEAFHDLLSSLDVSYTGESWDDQFEVTKEDWPKYYDDTESLLKAASEALGEELKTMADLEEAIAESNDYSLHYIEVVDD